jgi:2,3-bisphosphoglycerate-dependent phosphoglycerate mutase
MAVLAKVYLVRHGETEENILGIIQGQLDTSLNAEGIRQADVAAHGFKTIPFDMAYSSDLKRAMNVRTLLKTRMYQWLTFMSTDRSNNSGVSSKCPITRR